MPPRVLPDNIPYYIENDERRSAELQVYNALRQSPSLKGFLLLYSCEWLAAPDGSLRDGEIDFVLAHPDIGFICLEVKGGVVSRRVADGKWTSRDRYNVTHEIKNPVAQAKTSKHVVLKALIKRWEGPRPFIRARHGVILPHSSGESGTLVLGAGMPAQIFAFREHMATLPSRLIEMLLWMPEFGDGRNESFDKRGIQLLEDFYGRDISFTPRLHIDITDIGKQIFDLTESQSRYLDFLAQHRFAAIQGGAGTGKTSLAVERGRRAAAEGRAVLILCFNRPLAVHLASELRGTTVSVATFHEFCGRMCNAVGIDLALKQQSVSSTNFYGIILPGKLEDIGLEGSPEMYDDIIIDESQDFRGRWVEALKLFLNDNGSLFIFGDDFQNIYGASGAASALNVQPMQLNENVRNSQQIFAATQRFREGATQTCRGPNGPDVRWIRSKPQHLRTAVIKQLDQLVNQEKVNTAEIAILTGRAVVSSCFAGEVLLGDHQIAPADEPKPNAAVLDSIVRFKGLDRAVVILCDCETEQAETAYVGLSRAKVLLIVIGSDAALNALGRPRSLAADSL